MRILLGLAVWASVVGCKAGMSGGPSPTTPKDPSALAQPSQPPPLATLEGDYVVFSKVYVHDPMTDEDVLDGESADVLSIRKAPNDELNVKIQTVAYNYDQCYFEHTMTPSGPHRWRWKGGDMRPNCEVILVQTPTAIVITSNWDCYYEFCGHRATLEGSFPISEWSPAGSYEWPEM